jgi:hypothetical protein
MASLSIPSETLQISITRTRGQEVEEVAATEVELVVPGSLVLRLEVEEDEVVVAVEVVGR